LLIPNAHLHGACQQVASNSSISNAPLSIFGGIATVCIFSEWGVTRKFFGLLLAYRWGSLVRVGISLVALGLAGTWWLLAETAIKPIIVG